MAGSILIVYDLRRHGAFDDTRILSKNALMAWKWSGRMGVFLLCNEMGFAFSTYSMCFSSGFCWPVLSARTGGVAWILAIRWNTHYKVSYALGKRVHVMI